MEDLQHLGAWLIGYLGQAAKHNDMPDATSEEWLRDAFDTWLKCEKNMCGGAQFTKMPTDDFLQECLKASDAQQSR